MSVATTSPEPASTVVAHIVTAKEPRPFRDGDEVTFANGLRLLAAVGFDVVLTDPRRPGTPRRRLVDWPTDWSYWDRQWAAVRACGSGARARLPKRHIVEVASGRELPLPPRRPAWPKRRRRKP